MKIKVLILLILSALIATADGNARRRRTTRGNVSVRSGQLPAVVPATDTIVRPDSSCVRLFGYDKPLRSNRETVFVANHTDRDISSLSLTTQYIDGQGRQFHEVTRRIDADIPAGSTRKVDFRSWDAQQSFYYVGSKRSRAAGTPYSVRQSVDTIFTAVAAVEEETPPAD